MEDTQFGRALVLFAHPDDAEFMCGGTVARWTREGCEVHYVCITDGSAGSNEPGVTREELRPIRERELDGLLEVNVDTRRKVCREVRRLRPDVIVAPDPSRLWFGSGYINHSDHKRAGELALCAIMPDAPTRPMFPELLEEGLEPFEVPNLYLSMNEPELVVDVTEVMDLKLKALAQHASQLDIEETETWVRERAKQIGEPAGVAYGEGFKAFRFADED
jgi:LmbE family N-acetylglucosaminyl deacetylase